MTSLGEIREQLTGPGGAFEVVTEVVDGVEMKVYKDRMRLAAGGRRGRRHAGATQTFIVYGDRRIGFGEFVRQANGVAAALPRRSASATATGWPCCRPTTPSGA